MLIILLFISTIVMAISPAITMCSLSKYEHPVTVTNNEG